MVTFSLPGDNDAPEAVRGTPRPRAPLPFAKRSFAASPYGNKRLGTPQTASARKLLTTRDDVPSSSLNKSSIATARNIFRASSISDSPPVVPFSPSLNLPQNTPKKVFAPGATPEPSRVYRESTALATPRGMGTRSTTKDLFPMRIEDPDPELSGEALTRKIPKDWNSKGSIYADQFLAHLCPPDFDDEQRRQFFCVLDLRRLKYAANEIFSKKDWKLNVINFAKEFEKSRSIILLRYGLYEFQNVKPSRDVLKRWRREHGIAEPEDEEVEPAQPTPSKTISSKKRKADEESHKEAAPASSSISQNKRRATARDEDEEEPAIVAPPLNKNKRKVSLSEESEAQPSKIQKSAPSAAKSLFEKIANNTTTPVGSPAKATKSAEANSTLKAGLFPNKTNGNLARSVFQNLKPSISQPNSNIFGYLSDASSAKNSGVEADAESSTDSEPEESQEAGQSDEQDAAASNAETASQVGSALFGQKTLPPSSLTTGVSSAPGTRESTPGRSLFDRVTKDSDGQPVRAEEQAETPTSEQPAAPVDQTWNPTTTPMKFAPSASGSQPSSLFGRSAAAPTSSIFATKTTTSSHAFGVAKQTEKDAASVAEETDKGGESDKENDSHPPKVILGSSTPAAQSTFQPKPAEKPKETEPAKPASSLFGGFTPKPTTDKPEGSSAPSSNIFGSFKPAATAGTPAPTTSSSSTLFGAKPTASEQPAESQTSKPASILGGLSSTSGGTSSAGLFGAKPSTTTPSNIFGGVSTSSNKASGTASTGLFGNGAGSTDAPSFGASSSNGASTAPKVDGALPATTATRSTGFSFTSNASDSAKPNGTTAKPLIEIPKSPPSGTTGTSLFGGSPMKQDGPSPAKKQFGDTSNGASSAAGTFKFGAAQNNAPSAPTFGGLSSAPANGTDQPSGAGSGSFDFKFGADSSGSSFNNPFASGNRGDEPEAAPSSTPGGIFTFGSSTPAIQFGNASGTTSAPAFGAGSDSSSKPVFGGGPASGGGPIFQFQAPPPQPPQGGNMFGSSQPAPAFGNLQPPAGGASTTGTNTPFSLGGASSLATTPAGGTPEPAAPAGGATEGSTGGATADGGDNEEGEKHEQINLTEGLEADEEILHEVRAKVLKFAPAGDKSDGDEKPKSKSPWTTQGIGPLRLLKHKETSAVRLLLRAEPRGHVAMNRSVLPDMSYKADEKYVKLTTSNEAGDGLETWMIQVKTKDLAKELAEKLEEHKALNKQ